MWFRFIVSSFGNAAQKTIAPILIHGQRHCSFCHILAPRPAHASRVVGGWCLDRNSRKGKRQRFLSMETTSLEKSDEIFEFDPESSAQSIKARTQFLASQLSKWLSCTQEVALDIYKTEGLRLRKGEEGILYDYIQFLKEKGVDRNIILANPWILGFNPIVAKSRLHSLALIGIDMTTVHLLNIPLPILDYVIESWLAAVSLFSQSDKSDFGRFKNRLEYFAHHLDCSPVDVARMTVNHTPLLTRDLGLIDRIMGHLLEVGITAEAIKNDLWIFRHNEEIIKNRVARAKAVRMPNVKSWMLRCQERTFEHSIDKWCKSRDILQNHRDQTDYLADRLNCSREYMLFLAKRHPRLLTVNLPKLKQVLDFLFANGFDPKLVCMQPRTLSHSITTLQHRLQELRELGYKLTHLNVLCLTVKEYERLVAKLRKDK